MGWDNKSISEIWLHQKDQKNRGQVTEALGKGCEPAWTEESTRHTGETPLVLLTTLSILSSSFRNCGMREKLIPGSKRQILDLDDVFAFWWRQTLHYMLLGYATGRLFCLLC